MERLFLDADNDGDEDLLVPNGFRPESMRYHDERNVLLAYDEGRFVDVSEGSGVDFPSNSRGAAAFDIDRDGDLDVVITGLRSPVVLRNEAAAKAWLQVALTGRASNPDGFGARVTVVAGDRRQVREVGALGGGFVSGVNRPVHFGLGENLGEGGERVALTVAWPSGHVDRFSDVPTRQQVRVVEGERLTVVPAER